MQLRLSGRKQIFFGPFCLRSVLPQGGRFPSESFKKSIVWRCLRIIPAATITAASSTTAEVLNLSLILESTLALPRVGNNLYLWPCAAWLRRSSALGYPYLSKVSMSSASADHQCDATLAYHGRKSECNQRTKCCSAQISMLRWKVRLGASYWPALSASDSGVDPYG